MTLFVSIPQLQVELAPPLNLHFVPFTSRQVAKSPSVAFATATFGSSIFFSCLGSTSKILGTTYVADSKLLILKAEQQLISTMVELITSPQVNGPLIEFVQKQILESAPHYSDLSTAFQSTARKQEARAIAIMPKICAFAIQNISTFFIKPNALCKQQQSRVKTANEHVYGYKSCDGLVKLGINLQLYIKLPMYSPSMRQAFSNSAGLSARQSFLSSTDFELVKKKPVNFPAGSPSIGSKRMPINYERPAQTNSNEYLISISHHQNARNMTSTELRVQDYFHLRTAPVSSELFKTASNLCTSSLFNRNLLNTIIKQPNLNLPVHNHQLPPPNAHPLSSSGVSSSNVYHTPADRLGTIGKKNFVGHEISNSIRSMQQNSFNCNLNTNAYQPIVEPHYGAQNNRPDQNFQQSSSFQASYSRVSRAFDSLDVFLQFFYKELKGSYDKKDNISSLVAQYLAQMLKANEGSDEYKDMCLRDLKIPPQASSEQANQIIKKYGECKEMCKLIDGFAKQIDAKKLRNELDPHQEQYCQEVLKILQEIYTNYTREIYRYCHNIIPQESISTIRKTLQSQYNALINQYSQSNHSSFPHQLSSLFTQTSAKGEKDTPLPLFSGRPYIDYQALNQQKMKNHLYVLNYVKSCFEGFHEQQQQGRQQHFGHVVAMEEDLGGIDDFVSSKRRKERDQQFIIYLQASPQDKKQSMLTQSLLDRFETRQLSSAFSGMKVKQFSAEGIKYNRLFSLIHFNINIFWTKGSKVEHESFKHYFGTFRVSQKYEQESIRTYLSLYMMVHFKHIIRRDATFTFGSLLRKEKFRKVFSIDIEILQQKINFPSIYKVEARSVDDSKKCLMVNGLKISNSFGSIAWKQKINIQSLDFASNTFEIGDNTVLCEFICLNKPCLVTFFTFPKPFISWMEKYSRPTCEKKLKRHIEGTQGCRLASIDWEKQHYSIEFERFFQQTEETRLEEEKKDEESLKLEELGELYGIHSFEIRAEDESKEEGA